MDIIPVDTNRIAKSTAGVLFFFFLSSLVESMLQRVAKTHSASGIPGNYVLGSKSLVGPVLSHSGNLQHCHNVSNDVMTWRIRTRRVFPI